MIKHPKISVITPAYNCSETIQETYQSLLIQTYEDWEWCVVDDGSDDATATILQEFAKHDARVRLASVSENGGAAVARNKAIEMAEGRFLAFLDSDDIWYPQKLSTQLNTMLTTGAGLSYGSYDVGDKYGTLIGQVVPPATVDYAHLLRGNVFGCLTVMLDREVYGTQLMPLIRRRQDFAFWLNLLKQQGPAVTYPGVHARYRRHDKSLSSNKLKSVMATWDVYCFQNDLNWAQKIGFFLFGMLTAIKKRITVSI
ncbi:glycosyltransferase family 2 protein [Cognatishimia sp. 1_MG-2023]|uniref:glycosyltransferase family 2 protein n=1 Tax=Cognatishimia sp. 1_MG-2023 TaxID=3062642 RepID=UPI0026E1F124|nr:glycosyltransferase family 2 protein [Cognatishimia sp. 1_MG-2023]MDO6728347.1 glycosyltransferase family 2 protein [Cognatishimia sp. 1_MG-2023]